MIDGLLNMALLGGEPILILLLGLSMVSVAVIIERYIIYYRNRFDMSEFTNSIVELLNRGDIREACKRAEALDTAEAQVLAEGLKNYRKGRTVVIELMKSMRTRQVQRLDRRLVILGTIGSNAPFIGLLGTVLGIIKAFNDLAYATKAGPSVVMAGISEALVATAIGLLVAIPAVVSFNYFKNHQRLVLENISQLKNTLVAFMDTNIEYTSEGGSESSA